MNWSNISTAAKAVLPVIACHCDEHGKAFPGQETIAALSRLDIKTVRQGIKDLDGFPGFTWEYFLTRHGKRGKYYKLKFPQKGENGRSFFFYNGIIRSGTWSELKPTAKALYPVMRYFSYYDAEEDENVEYDNLEFKERFAKRRWELCSAEIGRLAEFAGINRRSVGDAIKSLQKNFLIEPYDTYEGERVWRVFLIPKKHWKPGYLNQKLRDRVAV